MDIRQAALKELARRELERREKANTGKPTIIEEQHQDIGIVDRLGAKNFANTPEQMAKYIGNQTGLQTRVYDGRVLAKRQDEKEWRVLDPDTGAFSSDILSDIGDVAYDVGSGILEGGALALGGLSTGGLGGVAAAGIAGAGTEAARQAIGKSMGIVDDIDEGNILASGVISGAVPVVGKYATSGIKAAAKGALKATPKVASIIGNQSKEEIEALARNLDAVKNMEESGVMPGIENIRKDAVEAIGGATKKIGEKVNEIISSAPDVNILPAKQSVLKRIDELNQIAQRNPTDANKANLKAAEDAYDNYFSIKDKDGKIIGEIEDVISAEDAWSLQQDLRSTSKSFNNKNPEFISRHPNSSSVATKMTANSFDGAEKAINRSLDEVTGGKATKAKKMYAKQKELNKSLEKIFKSKETLEAKLRTLDKDSSKARQELFNYLDKRYGTGLVEAANAYKTFQTFGKGTAGYEGISMKELSKQTPLSQALGAIGGVIGWKMGSAKGALAMASLGNYLGKKASSPKQIRKYVEAAISADEMASNFDKNTRDFMAKKLTERLTRGRVAIEATKTAAGVNNNKD